MMRLHPIQFRALDGGPPTGVDERRTVEDDVIDEVPSKVTPGATIKVPSKVSRKSNL